MSLTPILRGAICTIITFTYFIEINAQHKLTFREKLFLNEQKLAGTFPQNNVTHNNNHAAYRTFDGTNNNISSDAKALYGSVNIPLYRELPPEYGSSNSKSAMGGASRPSARQISNAVIDEPVTTFNARGLSSFVYIWGQFLDHDMTLTPTGTTEYVPISLPADEKIFTEEIPFYRSEVYPGTGVNSARQQTNLNTAWIDASNVYGCDATRAKWLRTLKKGKMKVSSGNLLPFNTLTGEYSSPIDTNAPGMANDSGKKVKTFVAGDIRAAEHPGLTSLHTLFVREHNRICDQLVAQGLKNDEEIYQKARKQVAAIIQAITYQEFLPAMGVSLQPYFGYNSNVRSDIANSFATAAYRVGHTMVADDIVLMNNQCDSISPGILELVDVFWNPSLMSQYNLEPFLKGLAVHTQYETDTKINSVLRNFLFVSPNDPVRFGIDLGSLNIQRGRDHGLPNYNAFRRYYTGRAATKFSDITTNKALASALQNLYKNINNVDAWVGLLAEDHLPNKSVGKTMHEMLRVQFENLRNGDYYFYKNDPNLSPSTLNQIINTKFSDVIKRNTTLKNIQSNVFFTKECPVTSVAITNPGIIISDKLSDADFKLYPNPVSNVLNVDLANLNESATLRLSTSNGVLVKTFKTIANQRNIQIDVSNLPGGIYFLNIINSKGTKSFKLVKISN